MKQLEDWTSADTVLAMHSANQDVIVDELASRFNFEENLNWPLMRKLCIPMWLKTQLISKLKDLIQNVANIEYKLAEGEFGSSRAEHVALFYVLLDKIGVLRRLYRNEGGETNNYYKFFGKDFNDPKSK